MLNSGLSTDKSSKDIEGKYCIGYLDMNVKVPLVMVQSASHHQRPGKLKARVVYQSQL